MTGNCTVVTCRHCRKTAPNEGRGLCHACWVWHKRRGRLEDYPKIRVTADKLFAAVDTSDEDDCWPWPAVALDAQKYGQAAGQGGAHRWVWKKLVGPLTADEYLDHECHNTSADCPGGVACNHRRCVNPRHLKVVTCEQNLKSSPTRRAAVNAAKTHCPQGHAYAPENLDPACKRGRACLACKRERGREYQRRKRAAAKSARQAA